ERVWRHIESNLDREAAGSRRGKWSMAVGVAAAVLLVLAAFLVGLNLEPHSVYRPATLEINDQAVELQVPSDLYTMPDTHLKYRKDGPLVPNYQVLWDHALVPRIN